MNLSFLKTRGETLAETLIAISILAIGITFAGTILSVSLRSVSSSRDRIIAVNLARAGIEGARNIRDTNWLAFTSRRRECWNHLPGSSPDECDGSTPITIGEFIVYQDENRRWRLREHEVIPAKNFDNGLLHVMDMDPDRDSDGDRDPDNDADLYNHVILANGETLGGGDDPLGLKGEPTRFTRLIQIDYLTNDGEPVSKRVPPEILPEHNRMLVTSTVRWVQGSRQSSVTLATHLTDYLGRESLDNEE